LKAADRSSFIASLNAMKAPGVRKKIIAWVKEVTLHKISDGLQKHVYFKHTVLKQNYILVTCTQQMYDNNSQLRQRCYAM